MLADMGVNVVCVAVPAVTRALYDFVRGDDEFAEGRVSRDVHLLKVKANAFGTTKVKDTRVTITDATGAAFVFTIDRAVPQPSSIFDHYVLQPVRVRE